jgi:LysR family glycine cleavage system transcriptional activator
LIARELAEGDLLILSQSSITTDGAYYFAAPVEKTSYQPLAAFRNWLIGNIA